MDKRKLITFKDKCPAQDKCKDSFWCLCGNFDPDKWSKLGKPPYVPLYVSNMSKKGGSYYSCRINQ